MAKDKVDLQVSIERIQVSGVSLLVCSCSVVQCTVQRAAHQALRGNVTGQINRLQLISSGTHCEDCGKCCVHFSSISYLL
jgi:hypothetical protein